MADLGTLNNVDADVWDIFIGSDNAPFHARLRLPALLDTVPVRTGRTGTDVIGTIVQGRSFEFELEVIQATPDEWKRFLNLAGASAPFTQPAVGALLATVALRLHDPQAVDNAGDIYLPAVVYRGVNHEHDGEGLRTITVQMTAQRDSNGRVLHVGPTS